MRIGVLLLAVAITLGAVGGGLALRRPIGRSPEQARFRELARGMSWGDRWHVQRAVVKGRAVRDPALAPAAIARADYLRAYARRVTSGRFRWVFPLLGVLQLLLAALRLFQPGPSAVGRAAGVLAALVVGGVLLTLPWQQRWYGRRAQRCVQLNTPLLP